MSDTAVNRISRLYEFVTDMSSKNKRAMIDGVAEGIAMIEHYYDEIFADLFPNTMSAHMLKEMKMLFHLDKYLSDEETRAQLSLKYKENFRTMLPNEFERSISDIYDELMVSSSNYEITIHNVSELGIKNVSRLQAVIDKYVPPFASVKLTDNGLTFAEWEQQEHNCFECFDAYNLSFAIIDTQNKEETQ